MESLYYYLLFEHGLHPGMANLLSKLVPGVLFGLAVGLSIIAAFAIFNGSGLVLARAAIRVVTAVLRRGVLAIAKTVSTILAKSKAAPKAESQPRANPDDPWLIYDDAPYLRGVMVTKNKEVSHDSV
ncbi:hypothetical protein [Halomonas casei]|uniref:hypothetical protein n=1 Tax=Halomonas casei TaxID=2742613 RepID=UPI003CFAE36B